MSDVTKQELIELVNTAISLLSTNSEKALELLHPYVPPNGPVTVDYEIYSLQYALIFGETFLESKKTNKSIPHVIGRSFEQCKTKSFDEYIKLITWISNNINHVSDQMKRAKVNLLIDSALHESLSSLSSFKPSEVQKLVLSLQIINPRHHLLGNAYKDMYEISFFLELLANLIIISNGGKFAVNPFNGITVNKIRIETKKGRLIKGLAINWLEQNSNPALREIIKSSYDNNLRNLIGGHNDYVFNLPSSTYTSNDGKLKFQYKKAFAYLSTLELLFSALRLDGMTRYFEDAEFPAKISEVGYMDWFFNKKVDRIIIAQYWSNYNHRDKSYIPKILSFYRLPVERKGKYISVGFDKKYIFPYDLRVSANNKSLELMKILRGKEKIKLVIASVAPKVSPFTKMSKTKIKIAGKNLLVIDSLETEVKIDKPALDTLIKYLEN